ncbi:hypothetical protein PKHYL_38210 [Psychrobacter sp. KH172YL61]|uniref:MFS transporter n=1 Tax=Psychrobacter sp. KH172YL61 TaxID=2517899 RepID=UPI0010B73160|nr:MFS transporter [Psychrobacter sp. KH172YL61]BBI69630.1 hypothetical protein PKHYL_38210 [Psychrobacter sp. KH172YL61]
MGLLSVTDLSSQVKQYLVITGNYWAFTLTDGALRMLVVLHFYQLGYSPLSIAMLFLFYEIFGVITNLVGGWLGTSLGLNKTMNIGLAIQIVALAMLAVPADMLTVVYVMIAQALSGIAKDLNKMSAKSAIKLLVPKDAESKLYQWVALLTGSKNALKGVGFFIGGLLLTLIGFKGAMILMASLLAIVWVFSLIVLKEDIGKATNKPKFKDIFLKALLSISSPLPACFCLGQETFGLWWPSLCFLAATFDWSHWWVGSFMASWVIGYGIVQSVAPYFTGKKKGVLPTGRAAFCGQAI